MADRVGQRLGNYRLVRLLGQGGFAEVYLGQHVRLNMQAAIKVLHTQLADDDLENFHREAQTIASLIHPHIVRLLDFDVQDGIPFLIMDHVSNGTLRHRHPRGTRLQLPTIASYVRQIAEALQYAHDHQVIHRDVKPENMLLGRNYEVLLSDFGIALLAQSSRSLSTQEVAGTAAYMAPEQFQGKPRRASDQYALGVVVYEWLTGVLPFHGSFSEMVSQHLFVPPPSLREQVPALSPDIEQVVLTALEKDPHRRFENVQAFAAALEHVCQTAPSHHGAPPTDPSLLSEPSLPSEGMAALWPSQPPSPTDVVTPPGQSLPPMVAAIPVHTPGVAVSASRGFVLPGDHRPSRGSISRRNFIVGLGLAGIAIAGGITWLELSRSSVPVATPTPHRLSLGTTLYTYRGYTSKIRALSWSPNGKYIAAASDDHSAQVWDALTGRHIITYQGHTDFVEGVAWSPDSTRIVSGSADGTAQIWDAITGNHIYTYRGHIDTYRSNPSSQGHPWVNRVSWSPDGTRIASCDQFSAGGHISTAQVWEASTGKTLLIYKGHTNGVFTVTWSPNGKYIASCGYDTTLRIWDPINGNLIVGYAASQALFGLAWSPDNTRIVVGGSGPVVWVVKADVEKLIYSYNLSNSLFVADVAWSPDGARIAAGGQETVHLLNASNGKKIYVYEGQLGAIDALCWAPDSKRIASGSDDSTVQIWEAV